MTLAGAEDEHVLVFETGEPLAVGTLADAEYLQRQWRIMNGIHPLLGGREPLFDREDGTGLAL